MRITPLHTHFSLLGLIFTVFFSAGVIADDAAKQTNKAIAWASADQKCVEPIETMRKQHMDFILHQRDETMHKGIRTTRHSLQTCVNCHETRNEQGEVRDYRDKKHFCSGCHEYAAVSIDCFQCHNSKPTAPVVKTPIAGHKDFIIPVPLDKLGSTAEPTAPAVEATVTPEGDAQ
jgi:hypothetical protein